MAGLVVIPQDQLQATTALLERMAEQRQDAIGADHEMVARFWGVYDALEDRDTGGEVNTLDTKLNHSRRTGLIAVSMPEFEKAAANARLQIPLITELQRHLRGSRSRKFVGIKSVNSVITMKSKKCWVFEDSVVRLPTME